MATEVLVVFAVSGLILMLIALTSWYRKRKRMQKELEEDTINSSVSRINETIIDGQRTFRIATVSRQSGHLSLDMYEIRLPRPGDSSSRATITLLPSPDFSRSVNNRRAQNLPPPPFSTAINMPTPSTNEEESPIPPPRYDEVIPITTISGNHVHKLSPNNFTLPEVHHLPDVQIASRPNNNDVS